MPPSVHIIDRQPDRSERDHPLIPADFIETPTLWLTVDRESTASIREHFVRRGRGGMPFIIDLESFRDGESTGSADARRAAVIAAIHELTDRGELGAFQSARITPGFVDAVLGMVEELGRSGVGATALHRSADSSADPHRRVCAALTEAVVRKFPRGTSDSDVPRFRYAVIDGLPEFDRRAVRKISRWVEPDGVVIVLGHPNDPAEKIAYDQELSVPHQPTEAPTQTHTRKLPLPAVQTLRTNLLDPKARKCVDATGLDLIEAPGNFGEAMMIARRIRTMLQCGTPADSIVVTARHLDRHSPLLQRVFESYGIPVRLSAGRVAIRHPAVSLLVRALRLASDDFPFSALSALLLNSYFRPTIVDDADRSIILECERLLRLLDVPTGKDAYLASIDEWIDDPPPLLEDESAIDRDRTIRLAKRCRGFLKRLFDVWKPLQSGRRPDVRTIRRFAEDLGFIRTADSGGPDSSAIEQFLAALPTYVNTLRDHMPVADIAWWTAVSTRLTPDGPGRGVRLLTIEQSADASCSHLFLIGLNEGSFPDTSGPTSLLRDSEREVLRRRGLVTVDRAARRSREIALFHRVLGAASKSIALSYSAVDSKGQPMLPSPFLAAVRDCFEPGAIPVESRRMPIEGVFTRPPRSRWEMRVGIAHRREEATHGVVLPQDVCDRLTRSRDVAARRLQKSEFGPYDGMLDSETADTFVRKRFTEERVYSPTAIETYLDCPFQFFMKHLLKLQPLESPSAELELFERGHLVHRVLARIHEKWSKSRPNLTTEPLDDALTEPLNDEFDRAVEEACRRSPDEVARAVRRIEGVRLKRLFRHYIADWESWLEKLREAGMAFRPMHFEVPFGCDDKEPLVIGTDRVRLSGRIDRIDVAEYDGTTYFWVMDYKTGRSGGHSKKAVESLLRLQLPLYALAAATAGVLPRDAVPLGMSFWKVAEKGVDTVMPRGKPIEWLGNPSAWKQYVDRLTHRVTETVRSIRNGVFPLAPQQSDCTSRCAYARSCRIAQERRIEKEWELPGEPPESADETKGGEETKTKPATQARSKVRNRSALTQDENR